MKGLRKYLTPFAPDQSGAVSVLYSMGGLLVIIDAGGCVGNICGFDEPRWQGQKSAVFSAGLRDMDAILGRDEQLVRKLTEASRQIGAGFAALIGTPVPAVIGTDYYALGKMAERKTGLPVLTIDTNGMELYDKGASKAYLELVRRFAGREESAPVTDAGRASRSGGTVTEEGATVTDAGRASRSGGTVTEESAAILGCHPLDISGPGAEEQIRRYCLDMGYRDCFIYGAENTLSWIRGAGRAGINLVVSPSGLQAARYLKRKFGTGYVAADPVAAAFAESCVERIHSAGIGPEGKILVVDQQVSANSMRDVLRKSFGTVTAATWFMMDPELKEAGDVRLTEEDDFVNLARGGFDVIIADPVLRRMIRGENCLFIEKNQFSVSGSGV